MRKFLAYLVVTIQTISLSAQKKCVSEEYWEKKSLAGSKTVLNTNEVAGHSQTGLMTTGELLHSSEFSSVIRIPVVFHVLYHTPEENVSTKRILEQLDALNRDFRHRNADSVNTPRAFRSVAADMRIEFYLAKSDPGGRGTSGIERKYTPVKYWMSDDAMKSDKNYGMDGWNPAEYLNIWICKLGDVSGYATLPGAESGVDGIVLSYTNILENGTYANNYGRTLVHEAGHWLNLNHIWGDQFCGDDGVADTPKQSTYTPGCPSGKRISCGNTDAGDMYMNFMDFTEDGCMNMFTEGQKLRARALFQQGGARFSILSTKAFNPSAIEAASLPDFYPVWMEARVYPNPATSILNMYLDYDERWKGKELQVLDMTGKVLIRKIISSTKQQVDVSRLVPGVYFIRAENAGEKVFTKFVKN
jgi:hypothetical protein